MRHNIVLLTWLIPFICANAYGQRIDSAQETIFGLTGRYGVAIDASEDSINIGTAGQTNQVFDFSNVWFDLTPLAFTDTLPTNLPDSFAVNRNDTWAVIADALSDTEHVFRNVQADTVFLCGSVGFPTMVVSKPLTEWVFPLEVGKSWSDTLSVVSGKKYNVVYQAVVDGSGTLKTADGEWPALRIRRTMNFGSFHRTAYTFLTKLPGYAVEVIVNGTGAPPESGLVKPIRTLRYTGVARYDQPISPKANFSAPGTFKAKQMGSDRRIIYVKNVGDTVLRLRRAFVRSLSKDSNFTVEPLTRFSVEPGDSTAVYVNYQPSKQAAAGIFFVDAYFELAGIQIVGVEGNSAVASINAQIPHLYPNPSSGVLSVGARKWQLIELYSLEGVRLAHWYDQERATLSKELQNGAYLVHAKDGNIEFWDKIILLR